MVKTFAEHSEQTRVENCTLVFKNWSLLLWNLKYFSTKYNLFFAPSKFPYMTARDQWQILQYCDASWPFSPCFLLTLRNPFLSECLGFITTPSLQYLMLPNQTAENGQVVFPQAKAHKMVSIVKKEGAVN